MLTSNLAHSAADYAGTPASIAMWLDVSGPLIDGSELCPHSCYRSAQAWGMFKLNMGHKPHCLHITGFPTGGLIYTIRCRPLLLQHGCAAEAEFLQVCNGLPTQSPAAQPAVPSPQLAC